MWFRRILAVIPAVALLVARITAEAQTAPRLGDAASFVVLGNSSVVNTGTATRITGNVGVSPSETIEGLSDDMFVLGDMRRNDALAKSARRDSDAADADLASRTCTAMLADTELGGKTFFHGVYCFTSPDVRLNGTVTFDAEGKRDAVFILRFAGALTTGRESQVLVIGNGYDGNVFWRASGAVSVGTSSSFIGNIFAGSGITFGSGARISGRALTRTGSVVLNNNLLLLCCAPITVSPSSLPNAALGAQYRQTFSASGGMAPYTFRISSGSPPLGLALVNGALQGTPRQTGSFLFTVDATDALGCTGTAAYVIQVDCGVATELESATLGVPYDGALFSAGTCTRIAVAFPKDLDLEGCRLKGVPKEVGTFSFIVKNTIAGERCFILRVDDCPIVITDAPPPGIACSLYSHTFSATCAVAPYVFTANDLPDGFGLLTTGKLSATVSIARSYDIDVTVKDALMRSHTQRFTINFACPPNPSGTIVLPPGKVGELYAAQLPPLTCGETESFLVPSPPDGLCVFMNGAVSCKPSKGGPQEFSVIYKSKDGCVVTGKARIDVDCPLITLSDLPPMVQGVDYDQTIVIGGINPPYDVTDSGLPEGIVRDDLRIHGKPSSPGPYTFTITVTHPATSCVKRRTYSPTCPALEIAPAVLPNAVEGIPYGPIVFTTSGGTPPYVYSISGSLPAGVVPSGDTLSGTPTASGPFFFTIKVTDKYGCTATRDYSIYVMCTVACPRGIPTLSEWALWLLMMMMASAGMFMMRRVQ